MTSTKKFLAALALTGVSLSTGAFLGDIRIGLLGGGGPDAAPMSIGVLADGSGTDFGGGPVEIGLLGGGLKSELPVDPEIGLPGGGREAGGLDGKPDIGLLGGG
jgi:hypothetical protein